MIRHAKIAAIQVVVTLATINLAPIHGAELLDSVQTAGRNGSINTPTAILNAVDKVSAQTITATQQIYRANPAAMSEFLDFSLSDFGIDGEYQTNSTSDCAPTETGSGRTLGSIAAHSYLKLSGNTTVWGDARFTTGSYRDICWNNASDYLLVAPYVIGDSVGGNLTTRQYSFMGGYAGRKDRWGWGAEAEYTAKIDYRARDPRDKIVVSDLGIKLGGTYAINHRYTVGIGGNMRIYNQESDVEFYNPNNNIHLYPLTGLGNYYQRFTSISDINTAYKGLGGGATLQLIPAQRLGAIISGTFNYLNMDQVLRDFNNLELTTAKTYSVDATLGWMGRHRSLSWGILATADISRRLGYENIFGSSVGNNYIKIGTRRNYRHDVANATLAVPLTVTLSTKTELDIKPYLPLAYSKETYRTPRRELTATALGPACYLRFKWRNSAHMILSLSEDVTQIYAHSQKANLQGLDIATAQGEIIVHNYALLTANRTIVSTSATADIAISPTMVLGISANVRYIAVTGHRNTTEASLNVAIKF
jgi:hypothetical protein